ncbi:MAG: glycosyltransferase [Hungatella sp.]|nr:glycosyltransferase [Hungatella sp.]
MQEKKGIYENYVKRSLDIVCSLLAAICFSWLYVIIAVLVRVKLGSPILFKQPRPGKDEKIFTIYKFRTMSNQKNERGELLPDDQRLGKFGRFLRATSLDELPEIFNILKGDMSLIGPRPQLVRDMVFMTDRQRMRHSVVPGLSGLAQVNGRNGISWEEKLEWDLKYIKNITFLNDLKIVFATVVKALMKHEGITMEGMDTALDYGDYLLWEGKISKEEYAKRLDEVNKKYGNARGEAINNYRKIDVVGGQITEFIGNPENIISKRIVPEEDKEIKRYLKKRCPMNHVTVMFRKSAVEKAGGYLEWFCNEDYYLWIRMAMAGGIFVNVPETLVNVRIGDEMATRRGGWRYFISEARLQQYMLKNRQISLLRFFYNTAIRFGGEVIIPNKIRLKLFQYLRSEYSAGTGESKPENEYPDTGLKYPPFSVAMSVYKKDNAKWFDDALASVTINQTVRPDEVVLVVDGPVPVEIQQVIYKYECILREGMRTIYLKENQGLGKALGTAVNAARNEIIARMDSDDLAVANRFEIQLKKLIGKDNA